jgi:hypothetical protein
MRAIRSLNVLITGVGRVEELIEYRALLHCAATHHALPYVTGLLQHPARARRGDKGDRHDYREAAARKRSASRRGG